MSDWRGKEQMNGHGRLKRPARQLPDSSSDSDSDISLARSTKRRKTRRVDSSSSESSSGENILRRRTKRRVTHRVMSDSDNGSDSGSSVVLRNGRKKVTRILNDNASSSESSSSDEEHDPEVEGDESGLHSSSSPEEGGSSSSDDDGYNGGDWHTDWSSDQDEEIQQAVQESLVTSQLMLNTKDNQEPDQSVAPAKGAAVSTSGFVSDSSDGESEKCPICLLSFTSQEIGTPESCDHSFCATCLQEWSKNMTTCPVDRQPFTLIFVRRRLEGKVIRKIPVEARRLDDTSPDDDPDPTFCEICGRSDREDRLLLCDGCDLGYHLECLDPPMENVPVDEWFCQDCVDNNSSRMVEDVDLLREELMDLLEDADDIPIRPRTFRLLPRTRQSERVRATIMSRHRAATEPAMQVRYRRGSSNVRVRLNWSDSD